MVALLVGVPLFVLIGLDRAIVEYTPQWRWAATETPRELLDAYRVEGLLRTLGPDPRRILILGNSTGNKSFDDARLVELFGDRDVHFEKLTIGAASTVTFGMLAEWIAELRPMAAVIVVGAPAVRSDDFHAQTLFYDIRAAPSLYTWDEFANDPIFHLDGVIEQASVLARQRGAIQRVALIRLGALRWSDLELEAGRHVLRQINAGNTWLDWLKRAGKLDVYPNPNTRSLAWLGERLAAQGAPLIVLESPVQNLTELLTGPRRTQHFRDYFKAEAASAGFAFVSSEGYPEFSEDDFEDMLHLNEVGRRRYTDFIAPILVRTLEEAGKLAPVGGSN